MNNPDVESIIQNQWLGLMQQEIGVLKTNMMLAELRCTALTNQAKFDKELINALTERSLKAEDLTRELQKQLAEMIDSKVHIKRKSKGVKP